jgi:hypothetical protein
MGSRALPRLGICPVIKGMTSPRARNNPARTIFLIAKLFILVPPKNYKTMTVLLSVRKPIPSWYNYIEIVG